MNEEPKMLSEYLRTENGKKFIGLLRKEAEELGEMKCKDRAIAYACMEEILYWLDDGCASSAPGDESFDMDVDEGIFEEEPESVMSVIRGFVAYNEAAGDLLSPDGDRRYETIRWMLHDYAA